ncbi:MAG: hypothetical protein VW879_04325 [Opitutae bacterium]
MAVTPSYLAPVRDEVPEPVRPSFKKSEVNPFTPLAPEPSIPTPEAPRQVVMAPQPSQPAPQAATAPATIAQQFAKPLTSPIFPVMQGVSQGLTVQPQSTPSLNFLQSLGAGASAGIQSYQNQIAKHAQLASQGVDVSNLASPLSAGLISGGTGFVLAAVTGLVQMSAARKAERKAEKERRRLERKQDLKEARAMQFEREKLDFNKEQTNLQNRMATVNMMANNVLRILSDDREGINIQRAR